MIKKGTLKLYFFKKNFKDRIICSGNYKIIRVERVLTSPALFNRTK